MGFFTKILHKLVDSFDNSPNGFSGRKLSAFITIHTSILLCSTLGTPENVHLLVGMNLLFALLCLGIVTAEQIIKYKNGAKEEPIVPDPAQPADENKPK